MDFIRYVISSLSQLVGAGQLLHVKLLSVEGGIGYDYLLLKVTTDLSPSQRGTLALGYGHDTDGGRISFHAIHKGDRLWELEWYRADRSRLQSLPETLLPEEVVN